MEQVLSILVNHDTIYHMKRQKVIFYLYNLIWKIALPFLKRNSNFKDSYELRTDPGNFNKTDMWIHGASLGEAYVAVEILKQLDPSKTLKILYTATTAQGLEIMESFCKCSELHCNIELEITWFPFDALNIIEKVILKTDPKVMVLLETEIWPSHLFMLKKHDIKTIIVNARLSAKSYAKYLKTKFIWQNISPDKILATSDKDAKRYKKIFGNKAQITTMPNIKFDSVPAADTKEKQYIGALGTMFSSDTSLSILASVRKEEETHLNNILQYLTKEFPDQVIAIFPKHIHRIESLSMLLDKFISESADTEFRWQLRSKIDDQVDKKTIILWDTFGELKHAYSFAVTAFVGGSLEPLGGQNFLEPVVNGAATVTGPYLNSFKWVDNEIFETNIVFKANNTEEVGKFMVEKLKSPPDRIALKNAGIKFIRDNQGGTELAVKTIMNYIK